MSRFGQWFETRLGAGRALRRLVDEEVPGGAKFTYALGSTTALTFLVLVVTGMVQLYYYAPTTASAYASVNYIRFQVPFGWLVHGLHYWAASLMVILALVHLAQVFVWGAFKKPREMTWILGVLLLLATLAATFTGNPLAWDEKGYWAARVGAGIAGSIPLIGPWLRDVAFGGATVGQLTLTHFLDLHVMVVPLLIGAILLLHLVTFRKEGAAGSFRPVTRSGPFYPDQALRDIIVFAVALALLIALSAVLLTPVTGAADPLDASYVGRPDWPFFFLFEILKYLPGQLEALGTVGVPLVLTLLLASIPWLDRSQERSPGKRPVSIAVFAVVAIAIAVLGVSGAMTPSPAPAAPAGPPGPTPDSSIVSTPPGPGPTLASTQIGGASHGADLFVLYCQECHGDKGIKGVENPGSADGEVPSLNSIDPEIKGKTSEEFVEGLDGYLQNGSVPDEDTSTPNASPRLKMPSFGNTYALTQPQIADLEAYVMQLNGVDRAAIVNPGVEPRTYMWVSLLALGVAVVVGGVAIVRGRSRNKP